MSSRERTVLVTGAAGYVGSLTVAALAARAAEGIRVIAVDVRLPEASRQVAGVRYVAGDITSPDFASIVGAQPVHAIIHLASILLPPPGAPADLAYRVDILGTRNVLEACAAHGVRRLVVTTSGASYGYWPDNPEWIDEQDPIRGNEDFEYSRNKRLIEELLAEWRTSHPELAQVVFRPCTVVGPSVRSPVTALFEKPFVLGIAGSDGRFVFIWDQDLVNCLIEGALGEKTGVFNVAGDGALTTREVARILGKPHVSIPAGVLRAGLGVAHALGLTTNGPSQVNFLRYRPVLSNRRLKEEFGYIPQKTSAEAFDVFARGRGLIRGA